MKLENTFNTSDLNPFISIAILVCIALLVVVLIRQSTLTKKYKELKKELEEKKIDLNYNDKNNNP